MDFPGSEDYEEGASPVRELPLPEQLEYWKTRSRKAERLLHESERSIPSATADGSDPADFWKGEL